MKHFKAILWLLVSTSVYAATPPDQGTLMWELSPIQMNNAGALLVDCLDDFLEPIQIKFSDPSGKTQVYVTFQDEGTGSQYEVRLVSKGKGKRNPACHGGKK